MLTVREIQSSDIEWLVQYWLDADPAFLVAMGVDLDKLPGKAEFRQMLQTQLSTPLEQKTAYCIIWLYNHQPVGHSNTNPSHFGEFAHVHLHLWNPDLRGKGLGSKFLKMSLPYFFENLRLKKLISEPYALNPAPHRILEKVGFTLAKKYTTVPGFINFEQPVKRWELTREAYLSTAEHLDI